MTLTLTLTLEEKKNGEEKGGKYSGKENIFFSGGEENKNRLEKEKEMNLLRRRFQELWGGRGDGHMMGPLDRNQPGVVP